jgi:hypothetical protein
VLAGNPGDFRVNQPFISGFSFFSVPIAVRDWFPSQIYADKDCGCCFGDGNLATSSIQQNEKKTPVSFVCVIAKTHLFS